MANEDVPTTDPATVDAVGKATEALEYVERARGHLYAFHQLIGRADFLFEESAIRLAAAGHREEAASLWREVVGRDVLEGRWTFEIVERFDDASSIRDETFQRSSAECPIASATRRPGASVLCGDDCPIWSGARLVVSTRVHERVPILPRLPFVSSCRFSKSYLASRWTTPA
jgi:hypothetical protein